MEDIREIVQAVVKEFLPQREEMEQERARRVELEQRVSELIAENEKNRTKAEEAERSSAIRAELQKLGVTKLDLAFKAVREEISRGADGRLMATGGLEANEYLARFVMENPELLPARLVGGSGAGIGQRGAGSEGRVDLDRIRPGMNPEELDRVRQEIARVASQTLRGQ
ncbi:MAG: hypothetical protein ABL967_16630 [Bryobacteraceae bacterium]